jgi:cephalosporin hydroxylase
VEEFFLPPASIEPIAELDQVAVQVCVFPTWKTDHSPQYAGCRDTIPAMKKLLAIVALCLLVAGLSGCRASEPGDAASPASPDPKRARQIEEDVATYERAVGKTHGRTPEEIHEFMKKARAAPSFMNRFLGVSTLQNPSDAWIIMEIMHEVKPDLMVETGTYHGGSAALWAIILEHINPDGRVITIDIEDQRDRRAIELPISKRRVDFLLGSSTDPEIVAEVHRRAEGKRVLVVLDSLHSKEHVAAELKAYAPLVPVGSYVIVQDTPVGPLPAIDEFLAANDSFVADRARERYPDTNTVRGYLRRVRP